MNKMKPLAITACVTILFLVGGSAIAQTRKTEVTTFQLGNQLTVIPAPDGFEEAASQFEFIKDHFSRTEVPDNDMLLVDLPRADCDKLRAGEAATFNFYTKVSVRKAIRDEDYSAERFADLVATFKKTGSQALDVNGQTMKDAVKQLDKGLTEINKRETKVALSQPVNLGEFDTRPNVYGVILMMTFTSKSGDTEVTTPLVASLSYVRIKQRLIYVYTYRKYNSATDVEVLRDFTRQWLTKILAAN
ncbi:MAG TPA: hypothetical protein DC047_11330 [Blastocatellia bacterium]|nr:hypothetical protein [Blastocatellia bacterium]